MAGIDKTYTDNYKDYLKFKKWADKQVITFFNGHSERIGNWVWNLEKGDFNNGEIPIMNTPTWLDVFLIQNCNVEFVLDRMLGVYGEEMFKEFQNVDLSAKPPEGFQQNRKILIKKTDRTDFPIHNKPYGKRVKWMLQCDDDYWFNDETKTWAHYDNFYPHNTNTAFIPSLKALVRHLRKQYLQKGITFTISGMYVGEEYSVLIR